MFGASGKGLDATLRATLEHAARAPFYRRTWQGRWQAVRNVAGLARLPILDKPTAAEVQERLIVPGVRAGGDAAEAGIVSSATTRTGRPLRMLRSPDEWVDLPDEPRPPPDRERLLTLVVYSPRHGLRMDEGPDRVLLPATPHPNTVDVLHDLLSRRKAPRFGSLVVPLSTLKWVTVALQERGMDPAAYGLQGIGTNGYTLTGHARLWLGRAWGCPLVDNYSLSEIPGYAIECEHCEAGHWEGARCVFELVDPVTRRTTRGNVGELVITTLVPSVLRMPLIRYATGDLVARGPRCPATGTRGMVFRGRISQSLIRRSRSGAQVAVYSRDLQEFAEACPDVAQHPHPAERLGRVPPSDIGVPKAVVDPKTYAVRVELRFDPARHPERAACVASDLARSVFKQPGPRPKIELLRPGSLDVERMALKL